MRWPWATTRSFNAQNQTASVSPGTAPTYDHDGNTITDNGQTFVYDAWNRLVAVKSGSTTLASYAYDAQGWRIRETYGSTTNDLYYDSSWQLIEARLNGTGSSNVASQYVWSPADINALILRDAYSNGVRGQRLYVQQDANDNVTAIITTLGNVAERYMYDPYGNVTVLDQNWGNRSSSLYGWIYLFQGDRLDGTTGWYGSRNRDYVPAEGRWAERDPLGLSSGDENLYEPLDSNPQRFVDPAGLQVRSGEQAIDRADRAAQRRKEMCGLGTWDANDFFDTAVQGDARAFEQFKRGCVGACEMRMGTGDKYPHLAPGARCFTSLKQALVYRDKAMTESGGKGRFGVFVGQSTKPPVPRYRSTGPEPAEVDPKSFDPTLFNFASYFEPENAPPFWEYMNHSLSEPDAEVYHESRLPTRLGPNRDKVAYEIFCVVPTNSRYAPPSKCKQTK